MARQNPPHISYIPLISTFLLILPLTYAQVGTARQDITKIAEFPLQKECARDCFVTTGFCPNDILGSKIGCAAHDDCASQGWEAKNDCYCRTDLQGPALEILTSCVSRSCTVGDNAIDAESAASIYGRYCSEKGYIVPSEPAAVPASTTGSGTLATKTSARSLAAGPTSSSSSSTTSSNSNKLSISTIIGIVVGSLAGLAFLAVAIHILVKSLRSCAASRKPQYPQQPTPLIQQPVYPMASYQEPYFPRPHADSEVGPDDSVSMVSGMPRPTQTLVSAPGYPARW